MRRISPLGIWTLAGFSILCAGAAGAAVTSGQAEDLTWSCDSSPCPWGATTSGYALVWPTGGTTARLGYTVSAGAYLPADAALGLTIGLQSGSAMAFAGTPGAGSHRVLGSISPNAPLTIVDLNPGEVVSVQSDGSFAYTIDDGVPTEPPPAPPAPTSSTPPASPPPAPTTPAEPPPPPVGSDTTSTLVTWTCTSSPCPWGGPFSGNALVWPAGWGAVTARLGYSTSYGTYLPSASALGVNVRILSGSASIYAGAPDAPSHSMLASLGAGQEFLFSSLNAGDVVSVQSDGPFTFALEETAPPPEVPPPPATDPPSNPPPSTGDGSSTTVTWTCTSSPCPWGNSVAGSALVWPADAGQTVTSRLGYTTSHGVYLPAASASGLQVSIGSGTASIYAGGPDAPSHRVIATLGAGQEYVLSGLNADDVVSLQADGTFTYTISREEVPPPPSEPPPGDPLPPIPGDVIASVQANWLCNLPGCTDPNWTGRVIAWPSWAAYNNNARAGGSSRSVFSTSGEPLYPYMGSWANGCEVTAHYGAVLIIEWERGTDTWREITLYPGETHTIHLSSPENGAMIESNDSGGNFGVSLNNCTPQPI